MIEAYLNSTSKDSNYFAEEADKPTQILSAELLDEYGEPSSDFDQNDEITLKFKVKNFANRKGIVCAICLYDLMDKILRWIALILILKAVIRRFI